MINKHEDFIFNLNVKILYFNSGAMIMLFSRETLNKIEYNILNYIILLIVIRNNTPNLDFIIFIIMSMS